MKILLDTHALVWLVEGSARLGPESADITRKALADGGLVISAISFWEVAMLVEKKRLSISMELDTWRKSLLDAGLKEIPITGTIGIRAALLPNFHGDPADRLIVATGLVNAATLMTADQKIISWDGLGRKHDARR